MTYCTYLTIYYGNKLPMFYIGYSTIEKVEKGEYHGSVSSSKYKEIWLREININPHLFKTKIITRHENKEDAKIKEAYFQRFFQVHKNSMYINMSISGEKYICTYWSPELRKKASERQIGRKSPNPPGSKIPQEVKDKISKSLTGKKRSKESIEKSANSRRGKKNKKPMPREGVLKGIETMKKIRTPEWRKEFGEKLKGEKNSFYGKKHSEEAKKKMREIDRSYFKGLLWWTNGKEVKRAYECPGEDWVKGRKKL